MAAPVEGGEGVELTALDELVAAAAADALKELVEVERRHRVVVRRVAGAHLLHPLRVKEGELRLEQRQPALEHLLAAVVARDLALAVHLVVADESKLLRLLGASLVVRHLHLLPERLRLGALLLVRSDAQLALANGAPRVHGERRLLAPRLRRRRARLVVVDLEAVLVLVEHELT